MCPYLFFCQWSRSLPRLQEMPYQMLFHKHSFVVSVCGFWIFLIPVETKRDGGQATTIKWDNLQNTTEKFPVNMRAGGAPRSGHRRCKAGRLLQPDQERGKLNHL